jgi:hypothetical protein
MASALAMTGVHAVLLLGAGPQGHISHAAAPVPGAATSGAGAMLAIIAVEVATAMLAATLLARLRSAAGAVHAG